jgi:hypothetical protein
LKKSAGIHVQTEYASYTEDTSLGHRNAHDQNFLADVIYPKILPHLLVHYSTAPVFNGEVYTVRFPFEWINDVYCGRIENDYMDFDQPPMSRAIFRLPPSRGLTSAPPSSNTAPPPTSFIPRPPAQSTLFLTRK